MGDAYSIITFKSKKERNSNKLNVSTCNEESGNFMGFLNKKKVCKK